MVGGREQAIVWISSNPLADNGFEGVSVSVTANLDQHGLLAVDDEATRVSLLLWPCRVCGACHLPYSTLMPFWVGDTLQNYRVVNPFTIDD